MLIWVCSSKKSPSLFTLDQKQHNVMSLLMALAWSYISNIKGFGYLTNHMDRKLSCHIYMPLVSQRMALQPF